MWIILICLVIVIKFAIDLYRPENFPPGPRGLPIVGNILDLKSIVEKTSSHGNAWCFLAKKYGPVVGLRFGFSNSTIIISGRDAVLELLGRREFDGRPNGFMFTHRTGGEKRGVLFTDGKVWADQRRNLKVFGWIGQTMEEMVIEDAVQLAKIVEKESRDGSIKNMDFLMSFAVLNSLWSIIRGSKYDLENGDPKIIEALKKMHKASRSASVVGGILNHLPFLRHVAPKLSGFDEYNRRLQQTWNFFADEVTRHKETWQPDIKRDLIDVYLGLIENSKDDQYSTFDELQLISVLKDLFSAGIDTTAYSIGFVIVYLTVRPDIQDKVQEELDRVIGRGNLPSLASRNSLPYLNATLSEVMRISNVGPTTIPHRATVDTTFMGYEIKTNYMLLPNLMSVHLDEKHWGDPEVFRPERFIDENGVFVSDPWLMPFGAGRRKCLGDTLAKNTQFLFSACLFHKLRFELPPGQKTPSIVPLDGFSQSPPRFDIIAKPR